MYKRVIPFFLAILLVLVATITAHANVTITITPASGISGRPGETVGWGFYLTNDSLTDWVGFTNSLFFMNLPATWGTYTDLSNMHDPFAPGSDKVFVPFLIDQSGAGSFTISKTATYNETSSGYIRFFYDIYNGDPTNGGTLLYSKSYDVVASVSTPEPSTYILLFLSLGVVGYARKKMKHQVET